MQRITIYAVAQACGVSASTVSRAFSRPEVVKPDVREKIIATARRLGYHTNRNARSLATGRTGTIGLLVTDITNPYFPPLVRAVQRAAESADATVVLVDAEENAAAEAPLVQRLQAQVDGFIVASPRSDTALREAMRDIPVVVVNRRFRGFPSVTCDTGPALQAAGDHLVSRGHRQVGLIRGLSASWSARQRASAVTSWAARSGVQLTDFGPHDATFDGGLVAARRVLESECTAVFAFDDLMACGVVAGLAQAGEQVPRDRALVGCDDVLLARTVTPALTTVAHPVDEIGRIAVELLGRRIAGEAVDSATLEGKLVLRASTDAAATVHR